MTQFFKFYCENIPSLEVKISYRDQNFPFLKLTYSNSIHLNISSKCAFKYCEFYDFFKKYTNVFS